MARISSDPIANYRGRIGKISYYIRECENMAQKFVCGKISDSPAAVAQRTKFGRLINYLGNSPRQSHSDFPNVSGTIAGKRLHVLE